MKKNVATMTVINVGLAIAIIIALWLIAGEEIFMVVAKIVFIACLVMTPIMLAIRKRKSNK